MRKRYYAVVAPGMVRMEKTMKIIVDCGLFLTVLILGVIIAWFVSGIRNELRSLNKFLSRPVKIEDSLIASFLRKK